MVQAPHEEPTVLSSGGATVVLQYVDPDHARLTVETERFGQGGREAGRLVCEAVHQARGRRVHHVETALEAAAPASCMVLEALQTGSGDDVEAIDLRRAGASVMVSLDVRS
jgi:hypothetical protein